MLWRVVINLWVVAVLSTASLPALAQVDTDLAKQHYMLGAEMHKRADFKGALQHFHKSYELSRRAALLYNIGKCHESLGEHQKAIDLFKQYLLSKPKDAELVYLLATTGTLKTNAVYSTGGKGGDNKGNCGKPGASGGVGRIHLSGGLRGTTNPAAK